MLEGAEDEDFRIFVGKTVVRDRQFVPTAAKDA